MNEERLYWLGFSAFPGIGPLRFKLLLDYFGSAKAIWQAPKAELLKIGLGEILSEKFDQFRREFGLSRYAKKVEDLDVDILTIKDKEYPPLLKEIPDAPFLLYVKGMRDSEVFSPTIAMVGTRRATNYGKEATRRFVEGLVAAGITIVSGLALGIDGVAHQATIEAGGKTIAVLGCGVDCCNPRSNQWLYDRIVKDSGMVVSEFPLSRQASKGLFPARNRIISGLSLGVIVIEGAHDSGSLITARYAAEQGREVFAVPGPITSPFSRATSKLIKSGATLVESAEDVLEALNLKKEKIKSKVVKGETDSENAVLSLLYNEDLHLDEIIRKLGWQADKVSSVLSVLEIKGLVRNEAGVYSLK